MTLIKIKPGDFNKANKVFKKTIIINRKRSLNTLLF